MAETIHLTVQSQPPVGLTAEQARVIRAVSPTATVKRIEGGAEVTVTDYEETTKAVIYDGAKGDPGEPGQPGSPGQPGVSPTASVTQTATGATVIVTDAQGTTTANLTNGAPGQPGQDGVGVPPGGTAGQVLAKASGADNDTVWQDRTPTFSVSGTTPTINALPGIRYVCGEVTTLDIVTPATGIVDVVFTSGSTPTVLTVTPQSGMTMRWANGFDPASLEANTVYEINVMDGCLGVAGSWT